MKRRKNELIFPGEKVLREMILPDLEKGRPDYDRPHTEAVIYWAKRICESEPELDKKILITAAYAHDWGYMGLFAGKATFGAVMERKKDHARIGAEKIKTFLRSRLPKVFSESQIQRIEHLVRVHDRLDEIFEDDEIALVEADTLGALDTSRVSPTFSTEDNRRYIGEVLKKRRPLFRHTLAIGVFEEMLQKRRQFYADKERRHV